MEVANNNPSHFTLVSKSLFNRVGVQCSQIFATAILTVLLLS
jgi:hypothetical protein